MEWVNRFGSKVNPPCRIATSLTGGQTVYVNNESRLFVFIVLWAMELVRPFECLSKGGKQLGMSAFSDRI